MSSDAGTISTGYRQQPQARLVGSGGLPIVLLGVALLFGIRVIRLAPAAIDASGATTFIVESIRLDRPRDQPEPFPPTVHAVPVPVAPVVADAPAPAVEMPSQPLPVVPSAIALAVRAPTAPSPPTVVAQPQRALPARPTVPAAAQASAADWRARLLEHLMRYRRYPRQAEAARQQGTARIAITLRRSGEVDAVELVRGSGYPIRRAAVSETPGCCFKPSRPACCVTQRK